MSNEQQQELAEFHWMTAMLQSIDVGIVVLDQQFRVKIWNGFMESHSGLLPSEVQGKTLFELYPDIQQSWFKGKARPVFELKNRAFMTWEQRPYLFKFSNYRPITGVEDVMYQNITLSPLTNLRGEVDHLCMMIYDMTDVATGKKQAEQAQVRLEELGAAP